MPVVFFFFRAFFHASRYSSEQHADRGHGRGGQPPGQAALGRGQSQLQPAAPADQHRQHAERRVRHLHRNSVLRLRLACECVSSNPPPTAHSSGNTQRPARRGEPSGAHHPLEEAEHDHDQHEHPVLQHRGLDHPLPESLAGPSGQAPRIVAHEHEGGQPEEHQRPVARPRTHRPARSATSSPISSTKRPAMWWLYSDHARSASVRGASGSSNGSALVRRRGQRGAARRELSGDLGGRGPIGDDVDGRRQRGERRRREQHGDAEPELHLDEAPQAQAVAVARAPHGAEIRPGQRQDRREDHDLAQHHHPVGGADERGERRPRRPRSAGRPPPRA